jgi:hypothetical protein
MSIIQLTITNENPLSKQLIEITGDSWNSKNFVMIGACNSDEQLSACKNRLFMHKASEQLFKIIN